MARKSRPAVEVSWWDSIPLRGQRAILSLLDGAIRNIPGALDPMTPEERAEWIERRKNEILEEYGL